MMSGGHTQRSHVRRQTNVTLMFLAFISVWYRATLPLLIVKSFVHLSRCLVWHSSASFGVWIEPVYLGDLSLHSTHCAYHQIVEQACLEQVALLGRPEDDLIEDWEIRYPDREDWVVTVGVQVT